MILRRSSVVTAARGAVGIGGCIGVGVGGGNGFCIGIGNGFGGTGLDGGGFGWSGFGGGGEAIVKDAAASRSETLSKKGSSLETVLSSKGSGSEDFYSGTVGM